LKARVGAFLRIKKKNPNLLGCKYVEEVAK
jgi:hypothetical protein